MDLAKLKEDILNEIMEKLDMDEGMKLKPKEIKVEAVSEGEPMKEEMGEKMVKPGMDGNDMAEDDEDDEDLKMLLKERMKC